MRIRSIDLEGFKIWAARGMLGEMFGITNKAGDYETGLYLTVEDFEVMKKTHSPKAIVRILSDLLGMAEAEYDEISRKESDANRIRATAPKLAPKADTVGHIYIAKTSIGTKIGISDNGNIEERMKTYKTLPIDIFETRIYNVLGYRKAERRLHEHFQNKRKSGEWFDLEDGDVKEAEGILFAEYDTEALTLLNQEGRAQAVTTSGRPIRTVPATSAAVPKSPRRDTPVSSLDSDLQRCSIPRR